jgi:Fe2+ transport system protein FeoA
VACVRGAEAVAERLAAIGLVPGAVLRVVKAGCPMTVAVGEARIALGSSWAEALVVVPS